MSGVKNEQTAGFISLRSGRQDRGTLLADGGSFTWESFFTEKGGANLRVTGASSFSAAAGGFLAAGVIAGDRLVLLTGPNAGTYTIATVAATTGTIVGTFPTGVDAVDRLYQMGSGKLSWDGIISLFVPGLGKHTMAAGSCLHIHPSQGGSPPWGAYADVNRDEAAALTLTAMDPSSATLIALDARVCIAQRGEDDRIYLMDGTVINNGSTQALGTIVSTIDRHTVTGDGSSSQVATGFNYRMGTDQLYVEVGGIGLVLGSDYTELDDDLDDLGDSVILTSVPWAGEKIVFINLAGAQGPQGGPGSQTLQEAYDAGGDGAGRSLTVASGSPVEVHEDGDVGDVVVFQAGTDSDRDLLTILSDGTLILPALRISDGDGGYFEISGSAGDLVIKSLTSNQAAVIKASGGTAYSAAGDTPTGSTGDGIRMAEYSGSLAGAGSTTIETGITTIKGVVLTVEDASGIAWSSEMNLASSSDQKLLCTYDPATGIVTLDGDVTGGAPGSAFRAHAYTVLVFY